MSEETRTMLGIIGALLAVLSYIPYVRNTLLGKTKPHAFSWLIWALVTAIGFAGQLSDNAGPGAWVLGISSLLCLIIFLLALRQGETEIKIFDWVCLICALSGIPLWIYTETPLYSVILAIIIDGLGFVPTFRKSFMKPYEETLLSYMMQCAKFGISLTALSNYSIVTALYPAFLVAANLTFVIMVAYRRRQIA